MAKSLRFLILLTVFLIPLVPAVFDFGYEEIKVLLLLLLLSLSGGFFLLKRKLKISPTPIKTALLVFILVLFITSITGKNLQISLLGQWPYYQGWITYAYLGLFFLLINQSGIKLKTWSIILSSASFIVALAALEEFLQIYFFNSDVLTYSGRVISTFGQPNFFAGFILINLPFIYSLSSKNFPKLKLWQVILFVVTLMGVVISFSRSANLFLGLIILLFLLSKLKKIFRLVLITAIFLAVITAGVLSYNQSSGLIWSELGEQRMNEGTPHITPQKRIYVWLSIMSLIYQKPVLGYGLENLDTAYSDFFSQNSPLIYEQHRSILINQNFIPAPVLYDLKNLYINRTHNYLLDLLIFGGVTGLISWLVLAGLSLRYVKSKIVLCSFLIFLIWAQFQNLSIVNLMQFYLLMGLIDKSDVLTTQADK